MEHGLVIYGVVADLCGYDFLVASGDDGWSVLCHLWGHFLGFVEVVVIVFVGLIVLCEIWIDGGGDI